MCIILTQFAIPLQYISRIVSRAMNTAKTKHPLGVRNVVTAIEKEVVPALEREA